MSEILGESFRGQVAAKGRLGVVLSSEQPPQMETQPPPGTALPAVPSASQSTSSVTKTELVGQLDLAGLALGGVALAAAVVFFIKR